MICIPVVAQDNEEALKQMERAFPLADIVELRIDSIKQVNLKQLLSASREKVLVTNRKRDEGGYFTGEENARVDLLREAVILGADYVDMEMSTEKAFLKEIHETIEKYNHRTKLIVSHHDFNGTPAYTRLLDIYNECAEKGADIIKIVTFANLMEDNLVILQLVNYVKKLKRDIIAFCMGSKGRMSRVASPLFGSYLSFASLEAGAQSAPGQLTVKETREIDAILHHEK
ncbi:MAG: type I 3-dehydroquinate dehydratase [Syntrophobacterales bacterium]|nr:type I 3-dehydroquinate dehydratase [Syntrophobacterales bacterium]